MKHILFASLLLNISCFGLFDKEEEEDEEEDEENQYSHSRHCDSEFAIILPDGTQTSGNFCNRVSLSAEYEFDPDTPPEIRNPILYFSTFEQEEGFECEISIANPSICSEGYYNLADNTGNIDLVTLDCEGISDSYEGSYQISSGYLHIAHLSAGNQSGNFEGQELLTSIGGYIEARTPEGLRLEGEFSVGRKVVAIDSEDQSCYFDDGDSDGDGALDAQFGGNDCDDNDSSVGSSQDDADCDGILTADDCDDSDPSSTSLAIDADCDGILTVDDCDDTDPDTVNDMDCDGVLSEDDCDDYDASTRNDMDCDGILTANDCDDTDPATIYDNDCDGTLNADDCDDFDENSYIKAEDGDCDGILTADDCDDFNPSSTIVATDADCDGVLTADDCDDTDPSSTSLATDADCDGVLSADDCDDNDVSLLAISNDHDCDGTQTNDDCDDYDASSTIVAIDNDCDTYLPVDDCDDSDASSTIVATDADCDGVLTADDCDDSDPATIYDMDCDGFPVGTSGLGCYSFYTHDSYGDGWGGNALKIYEDGVHTATIANNNPDGILYNSGGESQTISFCPDSSTSSFYITYVHGSHPSEISFSMYDNGNLIGSGQGSGSSYNGTLSFNGAYYYHNNTIYTSATATVYDCDDSDATIYPGAAYNDDPSECLPDADGDGYAPELSGGTDCDDNDANSTLLPDDQDCDGTLTADDCDDSDAGSTIIADDPDCDGQLGGNPPLTINDLIIGDLIITEIQAMPAMVSDHNGEWFEIYNNSGQTINLNGLVMVDNNVNLPYTISSNVYVPPDTYFVMGRNGDFNSNGWVNVDYVYGPSSLYLENQVGNLSLSNSLEVLDEVSWGSGNGLTASSGHAMSLDPDFLNPSDNDIGAHWCHSYTQILTGAYGTPGVENEQCSP